MASNTVKLLLDGIILVVESGYQTGESIRRLNESVGVIAGRLKTDKKPVRILVDLNHITGHDLGAEAEAIKTMQLRFDNMAIYTSSRIDPLLINTLVILNNNRHLGPHLQNCCRG